METGLMIRWGKVIPGREEQALALFTEAVAYYEDLKKAGKLTSYEPFLRRTADFAVEQGFFILKGPVQEIFAIMESDAYKDFTTKGLLLLDHFTVEMLIVGDDVLGQLDRYDKARTALHV